MKTLKWGVKRGLIKRTPQVFHSIMILALLLLLVGVTGVYSIAHAESDAENDESDTESADGSIRVCKIIIDTAGNVVDGSVLPGAVFTISGITPDPTTSEGDPSGVLPVSTFTTKLSLNTRILDDSTENDAQCKTYSDLKLGGYYYGEETTPASGWKDPKYNDQFTVIVQNINKFFLYDGKLFDGDNSNDGSRDINVDGHIILTANRPDRTLVVLNQYKTIALPLLHISKTNDSGSPETPGNDVEYTIIVTAPESNITDVEDVKVTDLPPAGFEFVLGSDSASQGSLTHAYASPGVWSLGTMNPGDVVTLTYKAKISGSQDAGNYEDLAFARGKSVVDDPVIANVSESTPFVGTDVAVVLPVAPVNVALTNIVERNVDTKTIHKTRRVLGAATVLPSTGANVNMILSALMLLLGGLILLLLSKRSTWFLIRSLSKSMSKAVKVSLFIMLGILFVSHSAYAASGDLNVQIETPKAQVSNPNFKIGFVALDILGRAVTVDCEKKGPSDGSFSTFETISLIAGGTSGDCTVNDSVMPTDGTYLFHVVAKVSGDPDETTGDVSVTLVSGTPSTPLNYSRAAGSCTVSFTTANDGLTDKVELYRSLSSTFTADASTLVATSVSIGPNAASTLTGPPNNCGDNFYAIRAIAASGLGSGFVGDEKVVIDNENKIKTETDTKKVAGPVTTLGAIPVTGEEAPAGAVEGAATGEEVQPSVEEQKQDGSVLGSATEAAGAAAGGLIDWIKSHPWWSSLWLIIIVLIAYYARRIYFGNYNENNPQR